MNKTIARNLLICVVLAGLAAGCTAPSPEGLATSTVQAAAGLAPTVLATTADAATPAAPAVSPTPPAQTRAPTITDTPAKIRYTVRPGDTLSTLAKQYNTSVAAIQLENNLEENQMLRSGLVLTLSTGKQWEGESIYWLAHTVGAGETLSGIAKTFGVEANDILRVNRLANPEIVRLGQRLIIPRDTPWNAPPESPTPVSSATPTRSPLTPTPVASQTPVFRASATLVPTTVPGAATATSVGPTATSGPTQTPGPTPVNISLLAAQTITLINQRRAAHGLPPYNVVTELMNSAQAHADDCSIHQQCGHTGWDGSDVQTREIRAGYTPTAWGENWVQELSPDKAILWWYNETPPNDLHRKNLLNTSYRDIGMGVAAADNGYYFIANFGSR